MYRYLFLVLLTLVLTFPAGGPALADGDKYVEISNSPGKNFQVQRTRSVKKDGTVVETVTIINKKPTPILVSVTGGKYLVDPKLDPDKTAAEILIGPCDSETVVYEHPPCTTVAASVTLNDTKKSKPKTAGSGLMFPSSKKPDAIGLLFTEPPTAPGSVTADPKKGNFFEIVIKFPCCPKTTYDVTIVSKVGIDKLYKPKKTTTKVPCKKTGKEEELVIAGERTSAAPVAAIYLQVKDNGKIVMKKKVIVKEKQ